MENKNTNQNQAMPESPACQNPVQKESKLPDLILGAVAIGVFSSYCLMLIMLTAI